MTLKLNPTQIPQFVPSASDTQEGVVTLLQIVAQDNVAIYVDSVNGDNNNTGFAPDEALQTFGAALSLVPPAWKKQCKIFLAPGTYDTAGIPVTEGVTLSGGPVGPEATPLAIIGSFTDELGTQTETAGDPNGVVATSGTVVVVDAYRGGFLSFTSGANVGQRRMIVSNTIGGAFTVNVPFFNAIAIGDEFIVEQPAVTINYDTAFGFQGFAFLGIKGIRWVATSGGSAFEVDTTFLYQEGCQFLLDGGVGGTQLRFWTGYFQAGVPNSVGVDPWQADGVDDPFSPLRSGAGVYLKQGFLFNVRGSFMGGLYVIDNIFSEMFHSQAAINGLSARGFETTLIQQSLCTIIFVNPLTPATIDGDLFGFESILNVVQGSVLDGDNLVINNCASGSAIFFGSNSTGDLGAVSGSGNAVAGLFVSQGSMVVINDGSGPTTVTGAVDTVLEGQPFGNTSYTTLNTADGNGVKGASDVYRNRITAL